MKKNIVNVDDAYKLLEVLNAPLHLITHVKLVSEAAEEIIGKLSNWGISLDYDFIRISCILHDTGKIIHISELSGPGHCHEEERSVKP